MRPREVEMVADNLSDMVLPPLPSGKLILAMSNVSALCCIYWRHMIQPHSNHLHSLLSRSGRQVLAALPWPGNRLFASCSRESWRMAQERHRWNQEAWKLLGQAHRRGEVCHHHSPLPEALNRPHERQCRPLQQSEPRWWGCRGWGSWMVKNIIIKCTWSVCIVTMMLLLCTLSWSQLHAPSFKKNTQIILVKAINVRIINISLLRITFQRHCILKCGDTNIPAQR